MQSEGAKRGTTYLNLSDPPVKVQYCGMINLFTMLSYNYLDHYSLHMTNYKPKTPHSLMSIYSWILFLNTDKVSINKSHIHRPDAGAVTKQVL